MNHRLNIDHHCDADDLNLETLALLPGFVYIKSTNSTYLWTNYNLSQSAVGKKSVDAIKGGTDFDFCWKMYAENMRKNDKKSN